MNKNTEETYSKETLDAVAFISIVGGLAGGIALYAIDKIRRNRKEQRETEKFWSNPFFDMND